MKITNDQVRVGKRSWNQLAEHGGWTDGVVVTQHGCVSVYAQGDDDHPISARYLL